MIDTRDWSELTLGERIRQIEVDGYVVLPGPAARWANRAVEG